MTDERRGHAPTQHVGDEPLDREIRRLLAVDPPPAFEARVRARVTAEPAPNTWRAGRLWMAFGAATAALVLAVAVFRPEPADTGGGSGLGAARAGGAAPPPSGVAARVVRDDPAAARLPVVLVEPNAAPEPAFPRALEVGFRIAGGPPRATAAPPGAPRFTRVVFSADERDALRQLLSQARERPVVLPVPAATPSPVATGEAPPRLDVFPITLEAPAGLEIPPITIEPLSLALLDPGAFE